jgi:hypothetical protein
MRKKESRETFTQSGDKVSGMMQLGEGRPPGREVMEGGGGEGSHPSEWWRGDVASYE